MNADQSVFIRVSKIRVHLWLNPFLTILVHFLLPDRDGAFELFDGPLTSLEGCFTMWRAGGDHDARFADFETSGAMHNTEGADFELLVSLGAEPFHFTQRHLVVRFVNEIKRSLSFGPFTRVAVERDSRSTLGKHDKSPHLTLLAPLCTSV